VTAKLKDASKVPLALPVLVMTGAVVSTVAVAVAAAETFSDVSRAKIE
jgi:hypothetical protein